MGCSLFCAVAPPASSSREAMKKDSLASFSFSVYLSCESLFSFRPLPALGKPLFFFIIFITDYIDYTFFQML